MADGCGSRCVQESWAGAGPGGAGARRFRQRSTSPVLGAGDVVLPDRARHHQAPQDARGVQAAPRAVGGRPCRGAGVQGEPCAPTWHSHRLSSPWEAKRGHWGVLRASVGLRWSKQGSQCWGCHHPSVLQPLPNGPSICLCAGRAGWCWWVLAGARCSPSPLRRSRRGGQPGTCPVPAGSMAMWEPCSPPCRARLLLWPVFLIGSALSSLPSPSLVE